MRPPRGLSPEEMAIWERLARTVTPLKRKSAAPVSKGLAATALPAKQKESSRPAASEKPAKRGLAAPPRPAPPPPVNASTGLDSHWERRLARSSIHPDFTLDLHGATLDQAHARLDAGLTQARAMGARIVLLVTGKPRPVEAADRDKKRGAIRAKVLDWLAAGQHADAIAAVRPAQRRHGGEGALYIVLRRGR